MKKSAVLFSILIVMLLVSSAFAADNAKKWTFMVFINADNNLDRFGVLDIQEMEKAGLSQDVNIIVQVDRASKPARRYDVTGRAADAKADDWGICAKNVGNIGEVDMGDYKEMVNFVKWAKENYPAENYNLTIWNHGAGWKKQQNDNIFKGISYDDQSGNHMTTPQLGEAMAAINGLLGKPLDILSMDACLMQMIEVSYEVRENVKYMVASEETEPGDGWPYHLVCTPLVQNPAMTAEELAKLIPQAYAQSYPSKSTTQSAVECAKLDDLAKAIDKLALAVKDACAAETAEIKAVKDALAATQKYAYADNIDLGHFAQMLSQVTKNEGVKEAINNLFMFYGKALMQNCVTGTSTKNSTGIAIYFPRSGFNAAYAKIKFAQFNWDEMVKAVTGAVATAETTSSASTSSSSSNVGGAGYPDVYPGGWGHPGLPGHPGWPPMPPMVY